MTEAGQVFVSVIFDRDQVAGGLSSAVEGGADDSGIEETGLGLGGKLAAGLLAGVAAALAAGAILESIGSAFDDAFDTIRVATGATGAELEALSSVVRDVSEDTPSNLGDIGDAVATLNQRLGLTGAPLEALAEQILDLSRITGTDLATNLENASELFINWGTDVEDQGPALDLLFRTMQETGVSVGDLAGQLTTAGPILRQVGFDFSESAAFVGLLGRAGVDAGSVMPALSRAIAEAAKEGKDAGDVFAETFDAIKGAATDTEAAGIAVEIFGARAGPRLAGLIREGQLSYEDLMATISGGTDTITAAADDTADWGEQWEIIKNRVLLALEPIATKVFEGIGDAMDFLAPKVDDFLETWGPRFEAAFAWLQEHVPPAVEAIRNAIEVAVAWINDNVIPVIEAVVGFIAEQWENLSDWTREHWDSISEAIGHVIHAIEVIVESTIVTIKKAWELFGDDILKILKAVWDQVVNVIETAVEIIRGVIEFFIALINGEWGDAWDALAGIVGTAIDFIVDTVNNVLSAITGTIGAIFDGAKELAGAAIDAIVQFVVDLPGRLLSLATSLLMAATALGSTILEGLGNGLSGIVGFLGDIASAVFEAFKDAWNGVVDLIVSGFQMAVDAADWAMGPWVNFSDSLAAEVFSFAYLHEGGFVPGPAGSDVPAILQAGEFVMSRDMLDNMNDGSATAGVNGWQGDVIVNNPVPEEASETVPRQLRNLQWLMAA